MIPGHHRTYKPGEAAESLKQMTREALAAAKAIHAVAASAAASRSVDTLGRSAEGAAKRADGFARQAAGLAASAQAIAEAATGVKGLRADLDSAAKTVNKLAANKAVEVIGHKAGIAALPKGFEGGLAAGNFAAEKISTAIVSQTKTGMGLAAKVVHIGMKPLLRAAFLPITIGISALRVGLSVAEAYLVNWAGKALGLSKIQIFFSYVALKVGLKLAEKALGAAVGAMTRVATFPIRVTLGALRAGLNAAVRLAKAAGRQIADAVMAPVKAAGNILAYAGGGLGLAGLVGVPAAIGTAVKLASDLQEATDKVKATFGESAGVVTKGADDMARAYGVVNREFMDGAASIGLIAKASGLADAASASMGVQFARLAGDIASLNNLSFEESLDKIRSGLVGEAEPMRTVGVLLSEMAVKSKAASMGFVEVNGQYAEGAKVQARAAIIMEQTKVAQGDLARTAGSLANRTRELWGRFINLATTLGGYLLPAAKELSATFADMAKGLASRVEQSSEMFAGWSKSLQDAASWVGIIYRNLDTFAAVSGSIVADLGTNIGEAVRVAFLNAANYARYFGDLLEERISQGISNGVVKGLRSVSGLVLLDKVKGAAGAAMDFGRDLAGARPAAPAKGAGGGLAPPALVGGNFGLGPELADALAGVKTFERFRALTAAAIRAREAVGNLAGRGFDYLKQKAAERLALDRRAEESRVANARFAMRFADAAAAEAKRVKLPKDFTTSKQREALEGARKMAAKVPDALNVGAQVAGMLAGGVGGVLGGAAGGLAALLTGMKASAAGFAGPSQQAAGLAEANSREAYSAVATLRAGGGNKPLDKVASNTTEQLRVQREQLALMRKPQGIVTVFEMA